MEKIKAIGFLITVCSVITVLLLTSEHLLTATLAPRVLSSVAHASTFYVSPSGSDANPGNESQPWRTIQKAADTLAAGDTVYIKAGTYYENVVTQDSGSAGNYITYAASSGDTVIIDGTSVTDVNNGFVVTMSYVKLSGLEIRNWNDAGIWAVNAPYLEISDCVVHDVGSGIGVADATHDFVLNRVEMYNFDLYGFDASPSGGADCYNGTFNDCVSHTGRDSEQNVDGFALGHGTQHNFVFNRCTAYDVFDGFDISARDTTLNRCAAYNCWNGGYKLWEDNITLVNCLGYGAQVSNLELDWNEEPGTTTLWNCTFMDAQVYNIIIENSGDSLHMYNCILAGGDNIGLAFNQMDISNYQGDYNIFHNDNADRAIVVAYTDEFTLSQVDAGAWTTYSGQDAHSLVVYADTELFVDPPHYDMHLLATSPAIDAGTSVGAPPEDYDGNSRPQGQGYDIGTYEYVSGTLTTTTGFSTTTTSGGSSTTTSIISFCPAEMVYGEDSEEIHLLRYLRDNILSHTPEGQEIIRLYYELSPVIVKATEDNAELKAKIRRMLGGV